jgi:predicted GNAT family acetyltransferase
MPDCRMAWELTTDIADFDEATHALLAAEPTRNTLLLSIPTVLRQRGPLAFADQPPRFGWFEDADGTVVAALVQTPPYPIVLSPLPDGAPASLVRALLAADWRISGVNASSATAAAVASTWCAATGASATVRMSNRLYLLGELVEPTPAPPGGSRLATAADLELLTAWFTDFAVEVGDPVLNAERVVGDRVENGTMVVWEVDGAPVSMAGISLLLEGGGIRVGPVYTPKDLRGRGYAGAATVASCRLAYDRGAREISLFADLANPTSNALYQRLGFQPLGDYSLIDFEGGES